MTFIFNQNNLHTTTNLNSNIYNNTCCLNAINECKTSIEYFYEYNIKPIIIDSGATSTCFTDMFLFDQLYKNNDNSNTAYMGSAENRTIITGIGCNNIFSKINHIPTLMWNLISLGDLVFHPKCWKHEGAENTWIFYNNQGNEVFKAISYAKNVFFLTKEYTYSMLFTAKLNIYI